MSQGREIVRRLLIAIGGFLAIAGTAFSALYAVTGDSFDERAEGALTILGIAAAYYAWRATVNWVLLYEEPKRPPEGF